MITMMVQLILTAMWATVVVRHVHRLARLAYVRIPGAAPNQYLHQQAYRFWWWLGRREFWRAVQIDAYHCLQLTLMIFVMIWMMDVYK